VVQHSEIRGVLCIANNAFHCFLSHLPSSGLSYRWAGALLFLRGVCFDLFPWNEGLQIDLANAKGQP
jgi:hypothetical protein